MAKTEISASRDRDVDNFSENVSRPRRRDRDHNPATNRRILEYFEWIFYYEYNVQNNC